jgi:hypothetical protein
MKVDDESERLNLETEVNGVSVECEFAFSKAVGD